MLQTYERLALQNQNWKEISAELLKLATVYVRRFSQVKPPMGQDPSDFVQMTITKLYTGDRLWDMTRYPNLLSFLKLVLISIIRNEYSRKSENNTISLDETLFIDKMLDNSEDEDSLLIEEIQAKIEAALSDQDEMIWIFELMKQGYQDKSISEKLRLPIKVVRNAKKKIRSRAIKVLKKYASND